MIKDYSVKLFIKNKWRNSSDNNCTPIINPATGLRIGSVESASISDLEDLVESSEKGFFVWKNMTVADRSKIMRKAADIIRERADIIGRLITLEQGKPLSEGVAEALFGADVIDWFAEEGFRVYGRVVPSRTNVNIRQMVIKEPVGPVAAFTPWNFPINQVVRKLGAALAAGCSIIIKAPDETPSAPAELVKAFLDAGIPEGVIGLVYGKPDLISDFLISNPIIKKITFTGSVSVGKKLASLAGLHMKKVTMELGGHAPVIICEDADIDLAIKTSVASKFRNAGQVCISPTRYLVHEKLYSEFASRLSIEASQIKVGDGLMSDTKMGPLANIRRVEAMESFVNDAFYRGAEILNGGKRIGRSGFFWEPTVIKNVDTSMSLMNNEPFGPIAAISSFKEIGDAIFEANRLPYGLASYAFTNSLNTAEILAKNIESGMLWLNMASVPSAELPFGGIKDSGYGTEGGPEALEAFMYTKTYAYMTNAA